MKLLLKIVIGFLTVVGAITIAAGTYLYVADPLGLKPLFLTPIPFTINTNAVPPTTSNPLLTPSQVATLEKLGIDPAKLPTTITPAMETCFVNALGAARVNEIKGGAAPTPLDLFKAKSCL